MDDLEQPLLSNTAQGEDVSQLVLGGEGVNSGSSKIEQDESHSKYGKFKDVESLLSAYNSLQSDYTKKCQTLSALTKSMQEKNSQNSQLSGQESFLEPENSSQASKVPIQSLTKEQKEEVLEEYVFSNPVLKDKFLTRYFEELNLPKSPRLIGKDKGSGFVLSSVEKPKTLEDAGQLVKNLLSSKD